MSRGLWNKRLEEDIIKDVEFLGYNHISVYYNENKYRKVIIQDKTGYKYDVELDNLLKGHIPLIANKSNPFTLSHNIPLWLKLNNSQFKLMENKEYKTGRSKLNLYCNKCKDYPKMTWHDIFKGIGCGICDGKQIGLYHNLSIQRPEIAKEWHPTKNGKLTPRDVTFATNKKVWWLCPNGHEYFSLIAGRTVDGKGCKICSDLQKESKLATELKSYILNKYNAKEEYLIFKNPKTKRFLPFDIYIFGGKDPKISGFYIEIHGEQHYRFISFWHKTKEKFEYNKKLDKLKKKFARKHGVYIEIDLRKTKTTYQAIEYVESFIEKVIL